MQARQEIEEIEFLVYPNWHLPEGNPKGKFWDALVGKMKPNHLLVVVEDQPKKAFSKEQKATMRSWRGRIGWDRLIIIPSFWSIDEKLKAAFKREFSQFTFKKGVRINYFGVHHDMCVSAGLGEFLEFFKKVQPEYRLRDRKALSVKSPFQELSRIATRKNSRAFGRRGVFSPENERRMASAVEAALQKGVGFRELAKTAIQAQSEAGFLNGIKRLHAERQKAQMPRKPIVRK